MTAGACGALSTAVGVLKSAGASFALVHESALMGWGIDNNAFLEHADVLLLDETDFGKIGLDAPVRLGSYVDADLGEVPARLWSRASLGLTGTIEVTACPRYGCEALAPEVVLRKLPYSPDSRLLAEQRAHLAAILHADKLTDEELSLVARYVRGD